MDRPRWETKATERLHRDKSPTKAHVNENLVGGKLACKYDTEKTRSRAHGYRSKLTTKYHKPHIPEIGNRIQYDTQQRKRNPETISLWYKQMTGPAKLTQDRPAHDKKTHQKTNGAAKNQNTDCITTLLPHRRNRD